jgi:murein DD-endopeptidase
MSCENELQVASSGLRVLGSSTHTSQPVTRNPFYLDLLGKEFQYGGRGPDAYDCYGLVIETRKRAGLFIPDDYASPSEGEEDCKVLIEGCFDAEKASSRFRELARPQPFCLVTFKIQPVFTTHIGMVLKDAVRFIHVLPRLRVAVERLDSPIWRHRVDGFWEAANE